MQRQMSGKQVPSILAIAPAELEFPSCNTSELGKISRSMHLTNKTDNLIVFKIKATPTNSVKYSALPLVGYVLPKATRDVAVWMRTPIEAPLSLQHRDEIIVQSARVPKSITASDLTTELVACRDYPHPRHLCVVHPFNKTRHETHCNMCYCCVCDSPAPCKKWAKKSSNIAAKHCDATGNKVYEGRVNRIWHYGVQ
ncbi:vesicle-associated protein 3-1-like [Chenopodium quinoa]|uniref:vesicle-associated protein 3-1-like n=1 Tax=Chenopodium quinoa TaxID=63459 RepID=UPI000B7877FB|nr:vesicle-associated protein 3-1-like [Chenopodium quinoa]